MTALTRGPLPARVYWTRRVLVLAVLLALVLAGAQLLRIAVGGGSEPDRAATMAGEPKAEPPADAPVAEEADESASPAEDKAKRKGQQGKRRQGKKKRRAERPVLAEPEGTCEDSDVAVTPTVDEAVGGGPITFVLELRTVESEACTWRVSPKSVTVKVTSGKDEIWSSVQCPRAIPRQEVVLRSRTSTEVEVTWSARRSEEGCNTGSGDWAFPGWYFIDAAALAGEPSNLHFEVTQPEPKVVTRTVRPKSGNGRRDSGRNNRGNRR